MNGDRNSHNTVSTSILYYKADLLSMAASSLFSPKKELFRCLFLSGFLTNDSFSPYASLPKKIVIFMHYTEVMVCIHNAVHSCIITELFAQGFAYLVLKTG